MGVTVRIEGDKLINELPVSTKDIEARVARAAVILDQLPGLVDQWLWPTAGQSRTA